MGAIENALHHAGRLDALARQDTPVHRLDPRVKVLTTAVFIVVAVSYDKYTVSAMLPLLLYPAALLSAGRIPLGFLLTRLAIVSPFALCLGAFNPWLDREVLVHWGGLGISGGWVSYGSILLRFVLTVSAAILLVATTGFNAVCLSLERFRIPSVFVVQVMLLYRYLFVLVQEVLRVLRAYQLRALRGGAVPARVYGGMVGLMLMRAIDRAQRVYTSMRCRGFDGEVRVLMPLRITGRDALFIMGWLVLFALARSVDVPRVAGLWLEGLFT